MLKIRVIPILTFNGIALVKTKQFTNPRMVGNPIQAAKIYNSRNVDELVFVDIMASQQHRKVNLKVAQKVINECFMPVTLGGGISTLDDIHELMKIGADKVLIKTNAIRNPQFIKEAVKVFGSQAIVIAVDIVRNNNKLEISHFDKSLSPAALEFIARMEDLGAGELIVNDVINDGMMAGFDTSLFQEIISKTGLPVIGVGGGGKPVHFSHLLLGAKLNAVAAGSIFHFTRYTPFDLKFAISKIGKPVRQFDYHLSDTANI